MSTEIALRPRAHHPGGHSSLEHADAEARRVLALRVRADATLSRSRVVRRLTREPLFVVPTLGALGHFLFWLL
jgi:hypothetical protein